MSQTTPPSPLARRRFIKDIAGVVGGSAVVGLARAQENTSPAKTRQSVAPSAQAAEREHPAELPMLTTENTGSDFMTDVLKGLGVEFVAACPGSTFRGLHESIINYGKNVAPELLTCLHEESSIAIAHGYAKVAGRPMAAMVHGTVGLQHASMAIYNAYADRVPMLIFTGNTSDASKRRPGVEWAHSVQDGAALVRDFTKWDDQPASLQSFSESLVRAHQISTSVPAAPVLLVADGELQEGPLSVDERARLTIPKVGHSTAPQGTAGALQEAARMLAAAEHPVIMVDRYARTQSGIDLLVQLAELLQAPVVDLHSRMNFPTLHPLNHSAAAGRTIAEADVILALEPVDLFGSLNRVRDQLHRSTSSRVHAGTKLIALGTGDLLLKANYQEFQRFAATDLGINGDAEASMPGLIEAANRALSAQRKSVIAARGIKLSEVSRGFVPAARADAAKDWDASPISTARMCMELWAQIKDEEYTLASESFFQSNWPYRLWKMDKHFHHIGGHGAGGVGYMTPASVGAALANKAVGRLTVSIVGDGDLMFAPGVLWTAAHHKIPLLMLVHNNRAYHQELMHIQRMANRHSRGIDRAHIGTEITNPNIDFAKLAQSMGVYAQGPVSDPSKLGPAIARALAMVRRGEPALIDVVSQAR